MDGGMTFVAETGSGHAFDQLLIEVVSNDAFGFRKQEEE